MSVLRLFFSREVMEEAATETASNYAVSGGVTVSAASRISGKVVELTTSELSAGTAYTVTVSNIRDKNGRTISVSNAVASFTGAFGVGPRLLSATSLNATTVRLVFNEAMNQTDLETEGNYAFAGPAAITAGTASYVNATTVDITISGEMLTGTANYTATVSGVRDVAGNLINASYDEATFNGIGVAPRVSSASVTGINTVRVVFNENMADGSGTTALTRAANYSFTSPEGFPISSSSVSKINATTVDITTTGTMETGTNNYRVTVINVKDAAGHTIDPLFDDDLFDGVGLPFLLSAVPTNNSTIRATFDVNMSDTGLTTPGNYAFTCPVGATITASVVTKITAKIVDITISGEMKIGFENYTLTLSNLTGALGGTIELGNNEDDFSGIGTSPTVTSATAINPTTVQVQFSEDMGDTGLTTNGNYQFTCPAGATITVGSVARVGGSSSAVNITVSGEMRLGFDNYTLTVTLSSVFDVAGNPILASNTDTFNGNGVKPQLTGAADVDKDTIDLTFDEEVDEITAENANNYTVSGAGSPDVSTATKTAATTVRLALATSMTQGTVTVTVSQSVTDLVGNPMDAGADEDSFDVDYAGPTLQSVAIVDHGHLPSEYTIELTFNENLKDEAAVTTESNYTITGPARGYGAYNPDTAVFGATHAKVRLTVNKELCNGESYEVSCINLHDEDDQALVDGTASFTGAEGAKPMVDDMRSEFVDASTIDVFYGEDMRNLGIGSNYLVRKNGTGTTIAVVDVAVPSNDCARLTLASPAESATYYDVIVDNASVTDLAGNYVEPLGDTLLLIAPA